jgi:hypothetical protein
MRLGAFLGLFVGLLVVVGLVVPVPGDFPEGPPGPPPSDSAAQCLSLTYEPEIADMPDYIMLRPDTSAARLGDRVLFWVDARLNGRRHEAAWFPIDGNSTDIIGWHHSRILRLPTHGDTLIGRTGWARYENLFLALTSGRDASVRAVRVTL